MRRTRWLGIVAVTIPCLIAGCQVPREAAWLPDSSGLLFTDEDGAVLRLDAATGKRETIVAEGLTRTRIMAVDPSGKRFALVRAMPEAGGDSVEVLFYGLDGKLVQKTEPVRWEAENANPPPATPWQSGAVWSPTGKHLLVWYLGPKDLRFGQCDVESGTVKRLAGITPLVHTLAFGLSPISDDDRGFLASVEEKPQEKPEGKAEEKPQEGPREEPGARPAVPDRAVFFIEWNGRRHEGRIAPEVNALLEEEGKKFDNKPGTDKSPPLSETPLVPFPVGRWEKGTAVIEVAGGLARLDTVKDTIEYRADERRQEDRRKMLAEGILYRVPIGQGPCSVQCRKAQTNEDTETLHVEIAGPEPGKTTRLGTLQVNLGTIALGHVPRVAIPSPDGKLVAVTYKDGNVFYTAVVNSQGKVVAKTPLPWAGQ